MGGIYFQKMCCKTFYKKKFVKSEHRRCISWPMETLENQAVHLIVKVFFSEIRVFFAITLTNLSMFVGFSLIVII